MSNVTAKTVVKRFRDGLNFHDDQGIYLEDYLEKHATKIESGKNPIDSKWQFEDGSIITIAGGCWDIGFAGCWCHLDAGHNDTCRIETEIREAKEKAGPDAILVQVGSTIYLYANAGAYRDSEATLDLWRNIPEYRLIQNIQDILTDTEVLDSGEDRE